MTELNRTAPSPGVRRYALALASPILAAALAAVVPPLGGVLFAPFFAAVLVTAAYGGTRPGFLATAVSVLALAGGVVPGSGWAAWTYEGSLLLGVFVLVSALISAVVGSRQQAVGDLRADRERLDAEVRSRTAELARANEELRRRQEALNDFVENATVGLHWVGPDGTILWANKAELDMLGYAPEEYVGRPIAEFHADSETIGDILARLGRFETLSGYESRLRCKDGSVRDVVIDSSVYRRDGAFVHTRCFTRDVTAQKAAERRLRDRERQQAAVADLGRRALAGADLRDLLDDAVRKLADTLGVEYTKVLELLPDGRALLLRAGVGWGDGLVGTGTVGAGTDSQAGFTLLSDGPVVVEDLRTETRFTGPPLLRDRGVVSGMSIVIAGRDRPYGVLGVHTARRRTFTEDDVHFLQAVANVLAGAVQRRQAEDELRRANDGLEQRIEARTAELARANDALRGSEQQFRTVVESAFDAIVTADGAGTIVGWNKGAERMFGYTAAEAVGRNVRVLIPDRYLADHDRAMQRTRAGGESRLMGRVLEMAGLRKGGGEFPVEMTLATWRAGGQDFCTAVMRDVTERERADAKVRESRERFELAARATSDLIWDLDLRSGDLWLGESAPAVVGWPAGIVRGEPGWWTDRVHPDDRAWLAPKIEAALRGDAGLLADEYRFRRADGTYVHVLDRACILRDADGRPVRLVGAMTDLTERKRAEEALRESEERFRAAFDRAGVGTVLAGPDGRFLKANPAFCRMLGYAEGDLVGTDFRAVTHPDDLAVSEDHLRRMLAGELGGYQVEKRYVRKDGSVVWGHLSVSFVPAPGGGVAYFVSQVQDVTERKRAEERLRREREFLNAVLEHASDGIVACDADGNVTVQNRAAREVRELPAGSLLSADWLADYGVYLPDGTTPMPADQVPLVRALRGEVVEGVEVVIRSREGTPRTFLVGGRAFHDADGKKLGAVVVRRDVTDQRRLEDQFRQAQKMEAVGHLAGGIAHDFNNLLTVINGYSELLTESRPPDDPAVPLLKEIHAAGQRATEMTRQLLAFSRQQVLQPRVLNLNELVAGMRTMLRRLIGEDVRVSTALAPGLGKVEADPGQVEQVLLNLAVNARDAMPTGGTLTVETKDVDLDATSAARMGVEPGRYVVLAVSDTGHGMTEEVRARVFEPFFTTKEVGKGTGLGLATVWGVAKSHGGHVEVESEVGRGTTFQVYFPATTAARAVAPPERRGPAPGGRETVLLVEDEGAVRALAGMALREAGYTVLEAGDAGRAVRALREYGGPAQLLLTDVVMPGASGRGLAERLTAAHPGLKVLYMSGYTDDAVLRHGVRRAEVAFIQKPFTVDTLLRKVREVLDTHEPQPAGVALTAEA